MTRSSLTLALLCALTLGCGESEDSDAYDAAKNLGDLTATEYQAFCDAAVKAAGGAEKTATCKDASDKETGLAVNTATGCRNGTPPTCTGAVVMACLENLTADPCLIHTEEQCKPFLQCATTNGVVEELDYVVTFTQDPPENSLSAP